MSEHQVKIDFEGEERECLFDMARDMIAGLKVEETGLMAKIREFNEAHYKFHYQKDLQKKVASLAARYFHATTPLVGEPRELCALALGYFVHHMDLIPDEKPFAGYLDDYLLISLLYDALEDFKT